MGRRKIPMIYIEDDRKRASTFEKRRIGLFKKASELNRLCGVDISVTIVNKNQVYKFEDGFDELSNPSHNSLTKTIEENFTNNSLLDFIKKKAQKITINADSDSVDHESIGDQNNISTDDEEDPEFIRELEVNNLLESYHSLQPDISPLKGAHFELAPVSINPNCEQDFARRTMAFGGAPTHEQSVISGLTPLYQPSLASQVCSVQELDVLRKPDMNYINELLPIDSTSPLYHFPNDTPTNSRWQFHKFNNPQHSQLRFALNSNSDKNYLETPELNNNHQQHLHANIPIRFEDLHDDPKSKRIKFSADSRNLTYFQHYNSL